MTSERSTTSRLFTTSVVEGRTEQDEKYDRVYNHVNQLTKGLTEKESHDVLNRALDDKKTHDDVCLGLLVGILSDQQNAQRLYHDLTLLSRDSLKVVTETLIHQIIGERFSRLQDGVRRQLLWLVKELVKSGVNNVEGVVWCLLRQIAGGDVSPKNVWLAESLVDILRENRPWLDKFPVIVASVAYTYLRILEDHHGQQYASLRQKETTFVVGLLRERFQDCLMIGRDLVRLLQNVARIPEIEALWRDILHSPQSLAPNFTGVQQLLQMRTSRRFFVVRLTPEMEKKMVFLCTDVKFGTQKRYQEWFQRQYLNTPESQTLRCDLIRFIIGCIHPSNEVLCSDIIPRWAVIGWLLSSCTSPVATANSKLSLFFDWLFYNTETDNIMNIEPGILVMYHSMRPHPVLTTTLLDFLCRIIPNFHPPLADKVRLGVTSSLRQILEKRVVQSLEPLFDNQRMDIELRKLIRETFPEFCQSSTLEMKTDDFASPVPSSASVTRMDLIAETGLDFVGSTVNNDNDINNSNHVEDEAMFSDEEEDPPTPPPSNTRSANTGVLSGSSVGSVAGSGTSGSGGTSSGSGGGSGSNGGGTGGISGGGGGGGGGGSGGTNKKSFSKQSEDGPTYEVERDKTKVNEVCEEEKFDLSKHLDYLEDDMQAHILDVQKAKDTKTKCDILQKICDLIIFTDDLETEESQHLAACLCHLLAGDVSSSSPLLPKEVTSESLQESLGKPFYVILDSLVTLPEDDRRRQPLLQLLVEMHKINARVGYHLIYFLKASNIRTEKEKTQENETSMQTYRDLCRTAGQKDFAGFMIKDLQLCSEDDPRLLTWVMPDLYNSFPKQTQGSADLLQLILERLDSLQLHDLVCMVLQGSLQMFDNHSFANILEKSLQWETVEQLFLWQLARAHEIPVDCCLSVLPKLKFTSHSGSVTNTHGEALSNILMMLRRESPSAELLRTLLLRDFRPEDPTVATILQYWVQRYEDKMAYLINNVINNKHQPSPNKRKRSQSTKSSAIPLDQVLSHLNHLRTACGQTKFFALATMQAALQTAQNQCSESQKKKYSDIFALIEEEEEEREPEPQKKTKTSRGRKPKGRKKQESESEEESSEEEDVKKPSRKRKKNHQVGSDSE
ncbi:integrator complex subunit 3 isoform X2 [Oratosquilla oratoria]|uniref:integrator complex subunit 3 isoform X2 n=1 Tax=Oratosquilla oratoria TaxID=337810 RepID=UPI003F76B9B4